MVNFKKSGFITWLMVILPLISVSQKKVRFSSGELAVYDAYYNWGFIWLHAGQARFSSGDTTYMGLPAYKLKAVGITFNGYDRLFMVRDTLESVVSADSLKPLWFRRSTNEGSYSAQITYNFNYEEKMVYGTKVRKGKPNHTTFMLKPNTMDMLSVIYYLRDVDFSRYQPEQKIGFNMVVDNEMWELYVKYGGKKTIKLKSGRRFRCLVLSPLLLEGSVFSGGEGMKIYVSDDRNRLPVYIESKVLVGKVKASLEHYENLKYPLTSELF